MNWLSNKIWVITLNNKYNNQWLKLKSLRMLISDIKPGVIYYMFNLHLLENNQLWRIFCKCECDWINVIIEI